ncbi:RxLR effector protein [Phytophthora megakarya]|uniref:RxLR effector protein n=1 Tax=Phytophthora megakarya TaxID=4795 RepID=A0A225V471_9STRA|nr:RxLR effector protein [Phytophthora megakarya]
MHISPVLLFVVTSLVFTSGVISASTDYNLIKNSNVASLTDSNRRSLRGHTHEDVSEARAGGIDKFKPKHQNKLRAFAKKLGFNVDTFAGYSKLTPENYKKYQAYYNKIYAKYHPSK